MRYRVWHHGYRWNKRTDKCIQLVLLMQAAGYKYKGRGEFEPELDGEADESGK